MPKPHNRLIADIFTIEPESKIVSAEAVRGGSAVRFELEERLSFGKSEKPIKTVFHLTTKQLVSIGMLNVWQRAFISKMDK
jgi:hypothetical protein